MERVAELKNTAEVKARYNTLLYKPELSGLKTLYVVNMFLLITLIVMPQYFGIHIGVDITCSRFANIILIIYSLANYKIFNLFVQNFLRCSVTIPLVLYLFVAAYTTVIRVNISAFMIVFFEILTFYMVIFAIRYVIGINKAIKIIIGCAYFLGVYGFVEFAAGQSLFHKFLSTSVGSRKNEKSLYKNKKEAPIKFEQMVYRALEDKLISISRASELLQEPLYDVMKKAVGYC